MNSANRPIISKVVNMQEEETKDMTGTSSSKPRNLPKFDKSGNFETPAPNIPKYASNAVSPT